jgi:hypothetical protein
MPSLRALGAEAILSRSSASEFIEGVRGEGPLLTLGGVRGSTDEADAESETDTVGGVRYDAGSAG